MVRAPSTAHTPRGARKDYLGLPAAVRLGHLVGEVGLLEARGTHALVRGGVGARGRVRGVEAGLDQRLPRLAGDHGLQLARGKRVHMARLAGHQQQDLGAGQRGQLVSLPAGQRDSGESRVTGTRHRAGQESPHVPEMAFPLFTPASAPCPPRRAVASRTSPRLAACRLNCPTLCSHPL